jgi:hypothetical protein
VVAFGTSFQPDEIKLMGSVLDEAAIILPEASTRTAGLWIYRLSR